MPDKIFISYRRDDVPGDARGIRDALAKSFGKRQVFMDVDSLLIGLRFDEELAKALDECSLLIAVIGPRWLDLLKARTASGDRDFVKEEITAALKRRIKVIPVRVGSEGRMPALPEPADLPEDIRELVLYQKQDITHERFGRDMADFIAGLRQLRQLDKKPLSWPLLATSAVAVLALFYTGRAYLMHWPPFSAPPSSALPTPTTNDSVRKAAAAAAQKVEDDRRRQQVATEAQRQAESERQRRQATAEAKRRADEEAARQKAEAERQRLADLTRPGREFDDCDGAGWCPKMVVVPAGSFMMGSSPEDIAAFEKENGSGWYRNEGPRHKVTIATPFAVGKFDVTWDEWDACVRGGGCDDSGVREAGGDMGWGKGKRPVINVSWMDARTYVKWLSQKTGEPYRLLTEAEWEYAARAGTTTAYYWGEQFDKAKANNDTGKTVKVGQYEPNKFGLYDMSGNVWQWVEDYYSDTYKRAPNDGSAVKSSTSYLRVLRGGSGPYTPVFLRTAFRYAGPANVHLDHYGFRVARSLPSPAQIRANSGNCIEIGRQLTQSYPLSIGTEFCDKARANKARVEKIANRAIVFSENGVEKPACLENEECGFEWPDKPLFRIRARSDPARNVDPSGIMLPR